MNGQQTLTERFQTLPRAMKWLTVAVLGTVLFFVWSDVIMKAKLKWDARVKAIEADVWAVRNSRDVTKRLVDMQDTVVAVGPVAMPANEHEGRASLNNAVIDVLKQFPVSDPSFDLGAAGNLPKEASKGIARGSQRLKRVTGDLRFEASPEDTVAILAALEQRDEIEAVTSVRLTRISGRKLRVRLAMEAWVASSKTGRS